MGRQLVETVLMWMLLTSDHKKGFGVALFIFSLFLVLWFQGFIKCSSTSITHTHTSSMLPVLLYVVTAYMRLRYCISFN